MLHDLLMAVAAAGSAFGVSSCVRAYIRARTERERWLSVERLAERHGPDVLPMLPTLARELRERVRDQARPEEPEEQNDT